MTRSLAHRDPWQQVPAVAEMAAAFEPAALQQGALTLVTERCPTLGAVLSAADIRLFGVQSGFFFYPIAQWAEWANPPTPQLERLGVALAVGHVHYAVQDGHLDGQGVAPELELTSEVALLAYLSELAEVTAVPLARVVDRHLQYFALYAAAQVKEVHKREDETPFSDAEVAQLAHKSAPIGALIDALATASGREDVAPAAIESLFDFCCGLQIVDDITDLAIDVQNGNATPPSAGLRRSLRVSQHDLRQMAAGDGGEVDLQGAAVTTGVAERSYRHAEAYFSRAADVADSAELPVLAAGSRSRSELAARQAVAAEKARLDIRAALAIP